MMSGGLFVVQPSANEKFSDLDIPGWGQLAFILDAMAASCARFACRARQTTMKKLLLVASHLIALAVGFGAGIYVLPILIAPSAPTAAEVAAQAGEVRFTGQFRRDLRDSDELHWGEGTVTVTSKSVGFVGELAPGPDYKLYLSPEFVETEAEFNRLKPRMVRVGDIKTFKNFLVPVPEPTELERFNTVIVWCESFGQFITSAKYR
jgi:hypothetical protein